MEPETLFKEGEEVLTKARKHVLVYAEDFLFHSFGCLVFSTGIYFLNDRGGVVEGLTSLLLCMLVLIFFTSFFYAWTKNYFDVWYITDVHIVAVNQRSILDREVFFVEYNRIQDVFFEKEGFLQTFFGYGRLKIQTAGSNQPFVIESIRQVESVAEKILSLRSGK